MDLEQLEILRHRTEEDFQLDMAAIERLQRRFLSTPNLSSEGVAPQAETPKSHSAKGRRTEQAPEPSSDELASSLRAMFNNKK
jgi:hypothetical protein